MAEKKRFVCVNCGHKVKELFKKYSNTMKTTQCDKCHQITDKYIEFEEFIILIDALLLDSCAFRHIIYNGDFKLYWKVSLVVLLLESFALCRQKLPDPPNASLHVHEKGFYTYTLQNMGDYMFMNLLLLIITATLSIDWIQKIGFRNLTLIILKVVLISNLSKFFLLPILVWRNNTTVFGRNLHHLLVMAHHLCSLVLAYEAVGATRKSLRWWALTLVVIAFAFKETARQFVSLVVEEHFT
ncbi:protein ARV 2 isoform X1 [Drosophila sechellia]|uniref:Protein ARV n=1 Tax=Drosophila sechellia TaxID=7238 RepID=B4IAR1_DROSE|nr:protein ARV 2 isoform X1 [Drosophila sechellia]EDW44374.1 GM22132 [Drosophila sechellia]